jgi:hypothetical protein
MPFALKSGSLNFLEPYRPAQDCSGTALGCFYFETVSLLEYRTLMRRVQKETERFKHAQRTFSCYPDLKPL